MSIPVLVLDTPGRLTEAARNMKTLDRRGARGRRQWLIDLCGDLFYVAAQRHQRAPREARRLRRRAQEAQLRPPRGRAVPGLRPFADAEYEALIAQIDASAQATGKPGWGDACAFRHNPPDAPKRPCGEGAALRQGCGWRDVASPDWAFGRREERVTGL